MSELWSGDPEPAVGTIVMDVDGRVWRRWQESERGKDWIRSDGVDDDPESWVRVAGNYGPVVLLKAGPSAKQSQKRGPGDEE